MSEELFSVELQNYEDLSDDDRVGISHNGWGPEYASYVRVIHRGKTIYLESDAMEPEDARFSRDLNWVVSALMNAYCIGLDEGERRAKAAPSENGDGGT